MLSFACLIGHYKPYLLNLIFWFLAYHDRLALKSTILLEIRINIDNKLQTLKLNIWIFRDLFFIGWEIADRRRVIIIILVYRTIINAGHGVLSRVASNSGNSFASCSAVFAFLRLNWIYYTELFYNRLPFYIAFYCCY